jgi:hypothetical protein
MRNIIAGLAGLLAVAAHQEARAATFAPDMWVYEVTLEAAEIDSFWFAWTDAAPDTPVPTGCTSTPEAVWQGVPYITITCDQNPGIDLFEPYGGRDAFTRTAQIGFNATTVACDWTLIAGCPVDGTSSGQWDPAAYFTDVMLDAATGTLSYCGSVQYAEGACYSLAPDAFSYSNIWRNIGSIGGKWDYGFGGAWYGYSPDSAVRFTGTGRLVSAPEVVPLPAPALLLGSTLLAFGAIRRARRTPPRANKG